MKVLIRYIWEDIRKNRGTSLSIITAVLLASTLLYSLCSYVYNQWRWQIDVEEAESGSWHGELGGKLSCADVEKAESNLYVEKTMLKGPFQAVRLPEGSSLPYLMMLDADQNYWDEMGEKTLLLEGRIPQKPGEIAVSKSFYDRNPGFHVGDTVKLPVGERIADGKALGIDVAREGERFRQTEERELTLVGKLDITTPTSVTGYYAMGYMDRLTLTGEEDLVVYVKMKNIRDTYRVMPQLGELLNLEKDEFGEYTNKFRYHSQLLLLYDVLPPGYKLWEGYYLNVMVAVIMVLLSAGAFVLITHSGFALSADAKLKQLGMFKSVGATPGQIRLSILFEAIALSGLPICAGIVLGQLFTVCIYHIYERILGELVFYPITVRFSWGVAAVAVLLSLITVIISAWIPARRVAGMAPIEAVRQQGKEQILKKCRNGRLPENPLQTLRMLAKSSYHANRKSYRASITSLTLGLILVGGFYCSMRVSDFNSERNRGSNFYNIRTLLQLTAPPEQSMLEEMDGIKGIGEKVRYYSKKVAYWTDSGEETEEFAQNGGLEQAAGTDTRILERDGKYRVNVILYGMDDESFADYCGKLGKDPADFYGKEIPQAIAISEAPMYPDAGTREKWEQTYPMLRLTTGQTLTLEEKTDDTMETDYAFPVEITAVQGQLPNMDLYTGDYCIRLFMPEEAYLAIASEFLPESAESVYRLEIDIKTEPEDDLKVAEEFRKILESYIASEDFRIVSEAEDRRDNVVGNRARNMVINGIGLLMGVIGISNAFAAVTASLKRRRREFAMLWSVGLDSAGISRLLALEGMRMAAAPVLTGLAVILALCCFLLWMVGIDFAEFMPWFPMGEVLAAALLTMAAVALAYTAAARRIKKDTIIEALRDENV